MRGKTLGLKDSGVVLLDFIELTCRLLLELGTSKVVLVLGGREFFYR
jgi:hypothetical protein